MVGNANKPTSTHAWTKFIGFLHLIVGDCDNYDVYGWNHSDPKSQSRINSKLDRRPSAANCMGSTGRFDFLSSSLPMEVVSNLISTHQLIRPCSPWISIRHLSKKTLHLCIRSTTRFCPPYALVVVFVRWHMLSCLSLKLQNPSEFQGNHAARCQSKQKEPYRTMIVLCKSMMSQLLNEGRQNLTIGLQKQAGHGKRNDRMHWHVLTIHELESKGNEWKRGIEYLHSKQLQESQKHI